MPRYVLLFFSLIFFASASRVSAQTEAFETISVGAFMSYPVAGGNLLDRWDPNPALHIGLRTPFYAGDLETGLRYTQFVNAPEYPGYSDFKTTFIYLGWGYDFAVSERFRLSPLLRFGTSFFLYDEAKGYPSPGAGWTYDFDTNESEFTYELLLRGEYRLSESFSAHAELTYNRTLTYHPIQLNYVTAGITYTFNTPQWLTKVLR